MRLVLVRGIVYEYVCKEGTRTNARLHYIRFARVEPDFCQSSCQISMALELWPNSGKGVAKRVFPVSCLLSCLVVSCLILSCLISSLLLPPSSPPLFSSSLPRTPSLSSSPRRYAKKKRAEDDYYRAKYTRKKKSKSIRSRGFVRTRTKDTQQNNDAYQRCTCNPQERRRP